MSAGGVVAAGELRTLLFFTDSFECLLLRLDDRSAWNVISVSIRSVWTPCACAQNSFLSLYFFLSLVFFSFCFSYVFTLLRSVIFPLFLVSAFFSILLKQLLRVTLIIFFSAISVFCCFYFVLFSFLSVSGWIFLLLTITVSPFFLDHLTMFSCAIAPAKSACPIAQGIVLYFLF
jgi:hypothetical protein